MQASSQEWLTDFGRTGPGVDLDRMVEARLQVGPHRVMPGEVLSITMPAVLQTVTAEEPRTSDEAAPYLCRVSPTGTITLPAVGEMHIAGMSAAQIEAGITSVYYPRYTTIRPSVYVQVAEYRTRRVAVLGAVKQPGLYDLQADKMTLVALLMEAGGIHEEGAAFIRVGHAAAVPDIPTEVGLTARTSMFPQRAVLTSPAGPSRAPNPPVRAAASEAAVLLPVRGLNIPFTDVALREGDTVVVEPLVISSVSVLGLVNRPGHFEYPVGADYNLGNVIALAGGLDLVANPRYATIYRLRPDGSITHAVLQIQGEKGGRFTEALSTPVKRGDIVAVEHTPRTRSNVFFDRVFRLNVGSYVRMDDLWD